jgi:YbbR domain-containing protein
LSIQVPDTLVVVVSEETKGISVALNGRLYRHLNEERLDRWLDRFQDHIAGDDRSSWDWIKGGGLQSSLINVALAVILATLAWAAVSLRTNPPQEVLIGDVPLNMVSPDSNLVVMNEIPEIINSKIQTTFDKAGDVSSASVSALLNLEDLSAGVHRVPVDVTTEDERVQVVSVDPNFIDVTLEPFVSIDVAPTYSITDPETLPLGYKLGEISLSPESISVKGPEQFVEQVNEVRTEVAIEGRKNSFQVSQLVLPLDVDGQLINGVRLEPAEILITVPVEQTEQTRQVPIYADIQADTIEDGFEINSVLISPPTVTLIGEESAVQQVGEFLATAPISLTNVFSEISLDVPLLLPEGVVSRGEADEDINTVRIDIQVSPVTNYLPLTTAPELRGLPEDKNAEVSPSQVSILLIGPQTILDEITSNPSLVVVYVDVTGLGPGLYDLPLEYESPSGVTVELFPSEVQVTINEQQ